MIQNTIFRNSVTLKAYFGAHICMTALLAGASVTLAQDTDARATEVCDRAARNASVLTGVPVDVLRAITRSETGRTQSGEFRPWPWTVNMEGTGKWFASRDDALGYAREKHHDGARSFDIGCFQLNHKWHGAQFNSISQMFDPEANALYAAEFLKKLYSEKRDWSAAAGAYHSRTEKYATRYRDRFDRILAEVSSSFGPAQPHRVMPARLARAPRTTGANTFPFLQGSSGVARFGSLVPLATTGHAAGSLFALNGG